MGLLWFRRGRGKDAKQEPEPELTASPAQARVPLRLRGLLLLNLKPADGVEQIETAPPLGSMADIVSMVEAVAPGIVFGHDGIAELSDGDYRFRIELGQSPVVHAAVVAVEGDVALEMLRTLMERHGWRGYAARAGVFIEPGALDLFALPDRDLK